MLGLGLTRITSLRSVDLMKGMKSGKGNMQLQAIAGVGKRERNRIGIVIHDFA